MPSNDAPRNLWWGVGRNNAVEVEPMPTVLGPSLPVVILHVSLAVLKKANLLCDRDCH